MEQRDIEGYEGLYAVTDDGRVWSYRKQKYLKSWAKDKYRVVGLSKDKKRKHFLIHQLVAKTFIPNPEGKEEINHKDENPANNNVGNLEWTTHKENCNYGTRNKRISEKQGKKVLCQETRVIYISAREAGRQTGISYGNISAVCRGERQTAGGFHWAYID